MGLGAVYAGEVELDVVMDVFVAEAAFDDAEESVLMGLFAALIEAVFQAQTSGVATNRLGEGLLDANGDANAPITSAALRDLANNASKIRNELLNTTVGLTAANLLATDGDNHNWALNGPIH